jgi:hypothetical protein
MDKRNYLNIIQPEEDVESFRHKNRQEMRKSSSCLLYLAEQEKDLYGRKRSHNSSENNASSPANSGEIVWGYTTKSNHISNLFLNVNGKATEMPQGEYTHDRPSQHNEIVFDIHIQNNTRDNIWQRRFADRKCAPKLSQEALWNFEGHTEISVDHRVCRQRNDVIPELKR